MTEPIRHFRDLTTWRKAHQLVLLVYKTTKRFPAEERFGLVSQMNRSAVSITSNLAEGFGRESLKERVHFYSIARGSLHELENQIILASDLQMIGAELVEHLFQIILDVHRLLNGLIQKTKKLQGMTITNNVI